MPVNNGLINLLYVCCVHIRYPDTKGAFQKSELAGWTMTMTGHFENEIGFFHEFLMKNDFLRAYYLGFD